MTPTPAWPPRGMRAADAAYYVGLSESGLRGEVAAGLIQPTRLTAGRIVFLRETLDAYLDRKAGVTAPVDAADAWLNA